MKRYRLFLTAIILINILVIKSFAAYNDDTISGDLGKVSKIEKDNLAPSITLASRTVRKVDVNYVLGNTGTSMSQFQTNVSGYTSSKLIENNIDYQEYYSSGVIYPVFCNSMIGYYIYNDGSLRNGVFGSVVQGINNAASIETLYDGTNRNYYVLKTDGTVWSWGNAAYSTGTGLGSSNLQAQVKINETTYLSNVIKIVANRFNVAALTQSGDVYIWGNSNTYPTKITNSVIDIVSDQYTKFYVINSNNVCSYFTNTVVLTGFMPGVKKLYINNNSYCYIDTNNQFKQGIIGGISFPSNRNDILDVVMFNHSGNDNPIFACGLVLFQNGESYLFYWSQAGTNRYITMYVNLGLSANEKIIYADKHYNQFNYINDVNLLRIISDAGKIYSFKFLSTSSAAVQYLSNGIFTNTLNSLLTATNWRNEAERFCIYATNDIPNEFANQSSLISLQNTLITNNIKLIFLGSVQNQSAFLNLSKNTGKCMFILNTSLSTSLTKAGSIMSEGKSADVAINIGNTSYTDIQISDAIENYLKPVFVNNNIVANVTINENGSNTYQEYVNNLSYTSNNRFIIDINQIDRAAMLPPDNSYNVGSKLLASNIYYIGLGNGSVQTWTNNVISANDNNGLYQNDIDLNSALQSIANYIVTKSIIPPPSSNIILGESIVYNKSFTDPENDPVMSEEWVFTHTPAYFTNNLGYITDDLGIYTGTVGANLSGIKLSSPIVSFNKTGKYEVSLKAQDNPKDDERFSEYQKWSSTAALILLVHRRPIADFGFSATFDPVTSKFIPTFTDNSYDLDHFNWISKGIEKSKWKWKTATSLDWSSGLPSQLDSATQYTFSLEVQDYEGAWSFPKLLTYDTANLPPTVDASPKTAISATGSINVDITASDPESQLKYVRYSVTDNTQKPVLFDNEISINPLSAASTNNITITGDGTYYLHMEAEDSVGNKFYRMRGEYTIDILKIYDFTIGMIYDLNYRPYFFDMSTGIDTDNDSEIDTYTPCPNAEIKTQKMPVNYYELIDSAATDVKAGVRTRGYIRIKNNPDSCYLTADYLKSGVLHTQDIPLSLDSEDKYLWEFIIPQDVDQDTFITFGVTATKGGNTYGNSKWQDTWDVRNTTRQVFRVKGSVLNSFIFNQTY